MLDPDARILIAHPFPDLYGADRMLLQTIRALIEHGHRPVVVVPEQGPLCRELMSLGVKPVVQDFPVLRRNELRPLGILRSLRRLVADVRRLRLLLRQFDVTLLYVNTVTLPHWILAGRLESIAVVCHVRELREGANAIVRFGLYSQLRLCDRVIANSEATRRFLARQVSRRAERIISVPNGIELPVRHIRSPELTQPIRLLLVGRLNPNKGQQVAIEALGLLKSWGLDGLELHLVGSVFRGYEWFEDALRNQAESLGLKAHVTFHGFAEDVAPHYSASHIVLVPSFHESFGLVAVEGMAAGRLTIVSDVGGLREVVIEGRTGRRVPPGDAEALASAIRMSIQDWKQSMAIARNAQAEVSRRFDAASYRIGIVEALELAERTTSEVDD